MPHHIPVLPYALYRADQVRDLDRAAIAVHGIPGIELMNRAGRAAYDLLRARWPGVGRLTVLAGLGNNGGDGYVVARLARTDGLDVRVLQLGDLSRVGGEAALALNAYRAAGGAIDPFEGLSERPGVIVDALFGTGLDRPVAGPWAAAIAAVNVSGAPVLAIDCPSGLAADTGAVLGDAVRAAATISFIGLKQGLFTGAGPDYGGALYFDALEVPAAVYAGMAPSARRTDWVEQSARLLPRRRTAHKGDFGHVLAIGGAPGMSGAARLAGEAALRAGAGLVTVATHPAHAPLLNLTRPELMVGPVDDPESLDGPIERATAIAIGPGLGRGPWGRRLWERVRGCGKPLVVDADALNLLAESPATYPDWVLTPHPGEAARLLGCTTADIGRDRFAAARQIQQRYGGVVVLKGAGTLIQGQPDRPPALCTDGNPGMATAGAGDVLTGVIAALLAQGRAMGLDAAAAAGLGVCWHAAAGDRAAQDGERGLIAGDILAALRPVANALVNSKATAGEG
ncbi:NAD(P)H-hydrate dehydratase [uncultured Thiodictyon sp.]|uniref:NAD(P)H-hydrate dehydratase n=1 Tax=uncultured Thiodictyon sp. TaxID=1846217 RepID=UPI0025E0D964|nr:NAD(P)H-hydrate dehydratase [uncultured Thiodictyon sp.]